MARSFDYTASDVISWTGYPAIDITGGVTVSAWIRIDSSTSDYQTILRCADVSGTTILIVDIGNTLGMSLAVVASTTNMSSHTAADTVVADSRLYHFLINGDGSLTYNNYSYYLNGVNKTIYDGIDGAGTIGTAATKCDAGGDLNGLRYYLDGMVAEIGLWTRELSIAEISQLANRVSPECLLDGLAFYAPLVRNTQSLTGGVTGSATGTTVMAHPPIIYPSRPQIIATPAVGGSSSMSFLRRPKMAGNVTGNLTGNVA